MNRRRLQLHEMTWKEVAERAGLNEFTLQRIRNGTTKLSERAGAKIDRALDWELGSAARIYYEDGEPALRRREHAPPDDELDTLISNARRELARVERALAELEREKQRRSTA